MLANVGTKIHKRILRLKNCENLIKQQIACHINTCHVILIIYVK